jgi:hypothetical protein
MLITCNQQVGRGVIIQRAKVMMSLLLLLLFIRYTTSESHRGPNGPVR